MSAVKEIDFYYVERPQGYNEYMLFPKYDNMPPTAYHGSKKLMNKLHKDINVILNKKYIESGSPTLFLKDSCPTKFRGSN